MLLIYYLVYFKILLFDKIRETKNRLLGLIWNRHMSILNYSELARNTQNEVHSQQTKNLIFRTKPESGYI